MTGHALLLVGGRRAATWVAAAGLCRDLTGAGVEVTVASMHREPEHLWAGTGPVTMLSLQPRRWEPATPGGVDDVEGADDDGLDDEADAIDADGDVESDADLADDDADPADADPDEPELSVPARARRLTRRQVRRARRVTRRTVAKVKAPVRRRFSAPLMSRESWSGVRRSAPTLTVAARSDLIVALDPSMVRAAWHLGRRYPDPAVVNGVAGAQVVLAERWGAATGAETPAQPAAPQAPAAGGGGA